MKYLTLIILWSAWCFIHSGMISLTVTAHVKARLGSKYRFYRLFYNLVALATFIPLILYSVQLKGMVLFRWEGYMTIVQIALLIVVLLLFIAGGMKYDLPQLLGIRQIKSGNAYSTLSESGDVNISGILSITRHPWYLAVIIFVWINYREMYISTLVVNIILTSYVITGTVLEEKKLVIALGDDYRDYTTRVSMLFPFKWVAGKLSMGEKPNSDEPSGVH